ncbi:hypothetical protein [Nocardia wallacei]|uniref:hypothetical protein n=1 Tax=Nocardia wallacei TaxID=480035 RepID=UPI0024552D97|nr:hypothetical protein [Nocardia wallacei]
MSDEQPDPMTAEPNGPRYQQLMFRARRGGYHLLREPFSPNLWTLHDATDGEPIIGMCTFAEIEKWLKT